MKSEQNVPQIRFKGFTDAWEQRELDTIINENLKPIPKPTGEYIRLGIRSHAKGTFHELVPAGGGLDVNTMYAVEPNNLIVNITFGKKHGQLQLTKMLESLYHTGFHSISLIWISIQFSINTVFAMHE